MDVFDKQYRIYRIVSKIVGLWPYDNSIYVWIQRICLLLYFLSGVIFQIIVLLKSEITLRNYILTVSETFPLLLFFLRYIYYITMFPCVSEIQKIKLFQLPNLYTYVCFFVQVEFLFNHIRTEEHSLQDKTEIQIQTKYLDISSHIIYFFGCVTFAFIAASIIFLVNPIILDFIMPLNESRVHFNVSFLFDDQNIYIKIFLILNCMLNVSLGLLCIMGTELFTNIFSYYICRQFHIAR
ncbi:uncharacterized protein LOC100870086 [Apis florea]|uniref:uncharacterized protein LOC100870086 n=1 Tax=Apis florea TaxID=7463 RepID=UPI0012FEBB1F|nr:uncharacterized protein LOC100870086 [Apis florea]